MNGSATGVTPIRRGLAGWLRQAGAAVACLAVCAAVGCGDFQARRLRDGGTAKLQRALNRLAAQPGDSAALAEVGAAARMLEKAAETWPESASIQCNLALAYWQMGKLDRAAELFRAAAKRVPSDARPIEFLAWVRMEGRQWDEARKALDEAIKIDGGSARALTARGVVELRAGQLDEARLFLQRALERSPSYAPALYDMGRLQAAAEQRQARQGATGAAAAARAGARECFEKYLQVAGSDARAKAVREFLRPASLPPPVSPQGPAAVAQGGAARVPSMPGTGTAATARQPVARPAESPAQKPPEIQPPPVRVEAAKPPAPAARVEPPPAAAGRVLAPAAPPAKSPVPASPSVSLAAPLIAQAKAAVENEEFDKALVSLTQAVRLDPGSADALWELAALYDRYLQDRAQAEKTYRRFQETFPQDARARLVPAAPRAAPAVQAGGSRAEVRAPAKADTRSAVQIWADGLERQRKGDLSGAVALYRRALERDATLPSGWYNMGLAYKGLGELEPARDAFARAVALQPDMIQGHFMLAVTSRDMKDNAVALRHLDAVLKMDPNYPKAHLLLGLIYRDQNREDLARRHLERYVELVPDDDPSAQEAREWMMGR